MFKKLAAAALTCALAVSVFTGCGSDTQTKAERPKDELVFVNYRDIRDLNPHLYAGEMYAQEMLYETLTTFTEDGGFKGVLAESWDISPDEKKDPPPLAGNDAPFGRRSRTGCQNFCN